MIRNTQPVHAKIADLYRQIERLIARPEGSDYPAQPGETYSADEAAILLKLEQPLGVTFADKPLRQAMRLIAEHHGVNVWIDESALTDEGIADDKILLAENGQIIEFDKAGGRLNGNAPTGRVLIDGKGVGDVGRSVLRERRVLSEEGLVAVTMAFDEETGIIIYGPEIVSRGFVFETETGHLLQDAQCVILEVVEEIAPDVLNRVDKIRSKIQTALRQYFFFTIGRRPVILPFIMEV